MNEVEEFYSILKSTVKQVPAHNFLVIVGDFNARLGPNDVNFTYNITTNRNREMLQDFMDEFNLFSANTSFMKPRGQFGRMIIQQVIEPSLTIFFLERNGEIVFVM